MDNSDDVEHRSFASSEIDLSDDMKISTCISKDISKRPLYVEPKSEDEEFKSFQQDSLEEIERFLRQNSTVQSRNFLMRIFFRLLKECIL
ncbi:7819_t:CDS:2 [Diversispora eburnea]|uniref:7819_t:CDS:1 n=1 Tax=Diversispora eburnea TaxID=1213867 RepID=A0A9N9BQ06_9GLOM|nr:7819_t:CDS:2 [Diversispora eburnea]